MENKNKRPGFFKRKYMIIPEFQMGFLTQISVIILSILIGFYFIETVSLNRIAELEANETIPLEMLYPLVRQKIEIIFAVKSLFLIFSLLLWGVFFSHKVAGPVWRVMQMMDEIAEGKEPENFELRKGDYFQDLGKKLEEIVKNKK